MNVSELARRGATTSETVRHYTDVGLLRPSRNPDNGYRQYGRDDLRLSLIHISEPTRPLYISYAVFCLKKIFF